MARRTKITYFIIALGLFVVFLPAFVSSAISIYLAVEWDMTLEPVHYVALLVTVLSYVAAKFILKLAFQAPTADSMYAINEKPYGDF